MRGPICHFLKCSGVKPQITKVYKLQITKSTQRRFCHFLFFFFIWQCHIFNDSIILLYSSNCKDHYGIVLLEKFSYCLSEIIQSLYYAILEITWMLHTTLKKKIVLKIPWLRITGNNLLTYRGNSPSKFTSHLSSLAGCSLPFAICFQLLGFQISKCSLLKSPFTILENQGI